MEDLEKTTKEEQEQKKEVHVKIRGTDYDITEARKREFSSTGHGVTRDEIASKGSPEPFGV